MAIDYYRILGIDRNADAGTIKGAYRRLAKDMHPDRNRHEPYVEDLFKRVNEAYRVLSNPEERSRYDQQLEVAARVTAESPQPDAKPMSNADIDTLVNSFVRQFERSLRPPPFDWRALPVSHYLLLGLMTLLTFSQSFGALYVTAIVWTYLLVYTGLTTLWANRLRTGDPQQDRRLWPSVLAVHLISLPVAVVLALPLFGVVLILATLLS